MSLFDLIVVKFGVDNETYARPFEFEFGSGPDPIKVNKISTTCPNCGAGNIIDVSDYNITEENNDGQFGVSCEECGMGEDTVNEAEEVKTEESKDIEVSPELKEVLNDAYGCHPSIQVNRNPEVPAGLKAAEKEDEIPIPSVPVRTDKIQTEDKVNADEQGLGATCEFIDPIEMGTFEIDEI
jgi:hypothetical protein